MEIKTIGSFLEYYSRIRERTRRVVKCIPPDRLEWSYAAGKFSLGDLIRHICAIERYLYAENVQRKPGRYAGHGRELADGFDPVLRFMDETHRESVDIFSRLSDADLQAKCNTAAGSPITVWKWLRAMVEHEIHHRGQIYLYLAMLEIPTPPLFGLTSEEVRKLSLG